MSWESAGMRRFGHADLVLEPVGGRAAALCRFTGHPGAGQSPALLGVLEEALSFAEELDGVDDVREFLNLRAAAHVWGHLPSEYVTLPELGEANTLVLGHAQSLLERLTPTELRTVAIALSVSHEMVALALELVEEAAAGIREFRAQSMADFQQELLLNDDRVGDAVDALFLEDPADWPPLQRQALVLALVWDVADLIACTAELSAAETRPAPLLWQAAGTEHLCASTRVLVPGTDLLVWSKIDIQEFEARPLFAQAAPLGLWGWSLDWQTKDGIPVYYKAGRAPSREAARWQAERATQDLLADPYRAKSPVTGDWLIPPP